MNANVCFKGDLLTILRAVGFDKDSTLNMLNVVADMPKDKCAFFTVTKDWAEIKCEISRV